MSYFGNGYGQGLALYNNREQSIILGTDNRLTKPTLLGLHLNHAILEDAMSHPSLHQTVTGKINAIKGQDLTSTGLLPIMMNTCKEQRRQL